MLDWNGVHRTAVTLRTALVGKPTLSFSAPRLFGPMPAGGRTIERVSSHGRHLEIVWDDGVTLHTFLRFSGSWHLYRAEARWHKPMKDVRVVIEVADLYAVCFNAPVVETFRQFDRHRHPGFGTAGPDLCRVNTDLDQCVERILHHAEPSMSIAEVLLDQHVVNGVGNVDRCEVLWAVGLSPFATAGSISALDAREIVATAARLLRSNVGTAGRVLVPEVGASLSVYGRNGQRCERCGDTIKVKRIGEMKRLLYWCPGCQARGDQRVAPTPPVGLERPMDPHPAAAMFLSELPWRRDTDHARETEHERDQRARPA